MNIQKYFNLKAPFIGGYSLTDLKVRDHITIDDNISDQEIDNLEYLRNDFSISITPKYVTTAEELKYHKNVRKIIERLGKIRKIYHITLTVENRELLRKSTLLEHIPPNVEVTILNDEYAYSVDEYLYEEKRLEELIAPIRHSSLSPLEKYLAVYDIVKSFKPYNENTNDKRQSRKLRYVLKDNNEYIVCVGFAKLLIELLNRVDIPCKYIHVDVDDSYDTEEVKNINHVGHARNVVKIDDDKYHVHGIYLADSTLDSGQKRNIFLHSLLTFDRLKEARNLEKLNDLDLLLDFHDINDFKKKIAYYLKKENNLLGQKKDETLDLTRRTYHLFYVNIMDILRSFHEEAYNQMMKKYNRDLCDNIKDVDLKLLNRIISEFTTDYYYLMKPLINNNIDFDTILIAATEAKRTLTGIDKEELKNWLRKLVDDNYQLKDKKFPYVYNPNDSREAFLTDRKTKK